MEKETSEGKKSIAQNRKARYEYTFEERIEAGLVLQGWEVKSLRAGRVNITDSYVLLKQGEAFLLGSNITPLQTTCTHYPVDPTRTRKLLLHQTEINKMIGRVEIKGYTLVAVSMYWKGNKIKLELALAKGKKEHDKRATIKERDWDRQRARLIKHKSLSSSS